MAGEVAGAVAHAAAHGVVGGATSLAMGGTDGTYEWAIEVRWRVVGKETGQGEVLGNRVQTHTLNDGTGSSTESKLNNTATRTP